MATIQVLLYKKEPHFELVGAGTALLFALPTLRSAQPGIPETPTVYDGKHCTLPNSHFIPHLRRRLAVGYFWNIALLGLWCVSPVIQYTSDSHSSSSVYLLWSRILSLS
jgi:hypothetical protein